ncbi:hypothetical protein WALSEDRAFT_56385 [Wallemia mellicola CBS 633.66]|uniref:Uncharacterized protein n=1 Tax=Wallemia mellicola (strain ATCC MYA-4683 / CBS 633.66) TaxID=671144 RepID=I4YGZ6_WALMC|nr:hypothetical protein WALSEDRAFT_56385 [Wallemia mellicola CBS 633.66]EIM23238.1 hypothetical protein WALSEDRAFT_56385 [Wallemia mellicola CBS 633.66]|eukprot:XP_006956629.1 hypothetical protein WALSEDRAFT_56385 [Wallemia mellicola CBS 633.66]
MGICRPSLSITVKEVTCNQIKLNWSLEALSIENKESISLTLNGKPWTKAHLKHSSKEEASLIVYGLTPGMDYELELKWLSTSSSIESKSDKPLIAPLESTLRSTVEQKDSLMSELKRTRKESQRHTASIQSEIEALKRTIDKNQPNDQRSKQKILSLQGSINKANKDAEFINQRSKEINQLLPSLEAHHDRLRNEWLTKQEQARVSNDLTAQALHQHEQTFLEKQQRLSVLNHKLDKLFNRKQKLEKSIPEIQKQIDELSKEDESNIAFNRVYPTNTTASDTRHHSQRSLSFLPFDNTFSWAPPQTSSPTDSFLPFPTSASSTRPGTGTSDRKVVPTPIGRPQTHTISEPFFSHPPFQSFDDYTRRRTNSEKSTTNNNSFFYRDL